MTAYFPKRRMNYILFLLKLQNYYPFWCIAFESMSNNVNYKPKYMTFDMPN